MVRCRLSRKLPACTISAPKGESPMKRIVLSVLILLVLPALALDLLRQRGWISEQPTWTLLGMAAATGVVLGRWLRNRQL